jgi:uncharacterized membrane protein YhaH (DUF805 family)
MRLAYGEGVLVAILAPFVIYLIGKINLSETFFLIFALLGVWTLVSAFTLVTEHDRFLYIAWGLILASFSSVFITLIQYAVALIILAIIASILINVPTRKSQLKKNQVNIDQSKPSPA